MAAKKLVKKKKKTVTNKKQYHLITDLKNELRDTQVISFDTKDEVQDYLVDELDGEASYDFEGGDDIVIYGEMQTVNVTRKTYKVNVK